MHTTSVIAAFCLLILIIGLITFYTLRTEDTTKVRRILKDLGLRRRFGSSDQGAQFYKWGWHQDQDQRISAERMVKQAFQQAGVWLDRHDLSFFENLCKQYEVQNEVREEQIEERILEIIKRSELVKRWVADQVRSIVRSIRLMDAPKAKEILQQFEIEAEEKDAREQLLGLRLWRMFYQHGGQILSIHADGLKILDSAHNHTFVLENMDSWRHLLRMFKEEMLEIANSGAAAIEPTLGRAMRRFIAKDFFHEMEVDVERHDSFVRKIRDQHQNKEINLPLERLRAIESIFYRWKFEEGIHFNQRDHNCMRDILCRLDLSPRFREILIDHIGESFSSLFNILRMFPREVLFYGGSGVARSFAADQYLRHLHALQEALAAPTGREAKSPSIVCINDEAIEKKRKGPKRGSKAQTMAQLISDQKRISRLKRGISEAEADIRGWIVHLSTHYLLDEEIKELQQKPFTRYRLVNCEIGEKVDFLNDAYKAKQGRVQFFNRIIDSLTKPPERKRPSTKQTQPRQPKDTQDIADESNPPSFQEGKEEKRETSPENQKQEAAASPPQDPAATPQE
ncbi:MAG: hypothetical protein JXR73_12750 [Candidatus Omnitrophica bacterium]|nr:hypothetical protein [Candidatus Omnitrophota bacterium]